VRPAVLEAVQLHRELSRRRGELRVQTPRRRARANAMLQ
jgi:hypothetical protein